jgi:hypothetical protein
MNRRNLFKSLAAICAAPLVKWLPGKEPDLIAFSDVRTDTLTFSSGNGISVVSKDGCWIIEGDLQPAEWKCLSGGSIEVLDV